MKTADRERAGEIDWQEYRARLDRVLAAMHDQGEYSSEQARAVMDERARILARAPESRPRAEEVIEVITFALAGEHYAIETRHVRRVEWPGPITPVPGTPDLLTGVVNLGGEILDVIDLRSVLCLKGARPQLAETSPLVILGGSRDEFGVLADAVHEVRTLRTDEVLDPVGSVLGIDRPHLRGVTGAALIVLDGAGLIQDDRLVIDQDEGPTGPSRP